jgi:hypothetical protein
MHRSFPPYPRLVLVKLNQSLPGADFRENRVPAEKSGQRTCPEYLCTWIQGFVHMNTNFVYLDLNFFGNFWTDDYLNRTFICILLESLCVFE